LPPFAPLLIFKYYSAHFSLVLKLLLKSCAHVFLLRLTVHCFQVQFKLITVPAGGVGGMREYICKNSDKLDSNRFRWVTNRDTPWEQIHAWGGEWRRKNPTV
jgi:hypothetical protein